MYPPAIFEESDRMRLPCTAVRIQLRGSRTPSHNPSSRSGSLPALILCLAAASAAANADNGLQRCAKLVDDVARLACYDGLAKQPVTTAGQALPAPGQTPPRDDDGAAPATGPGQEHVQPARTVEDAEYTAALLGVGENNYGRLLFELDNGQVWRQLDSRFVALPDAFPAEVTITKGLLGSFNLRIGDDGRRIKVRRVK